MTPEQEAVLKLIFERAGEHRGSAHVDTTGLNRHILNSLVRDRYLSVNADNTVTMTGTGITAGMRMRLGGTAGPKPVHPNGTDPGDHDGQL